MFLIIAYLWAHKSFFLKRAHSSETILINIFLIFIFTYYGIYSYLHLLFTYQFTRLFVFILHFTPCLPMRKNCYLVSKSKKPLYLVLKTR